jgi:hypothetical protein
MGTGERRNINRADESNAVMNSHFDESLDQSGKKFFLFPRIKIVQDEWTKGSRDGEFL